MKSPWRSNQKRWENKLAISNNNKNTKHLLNHKMWQVNLWRQNENNNGKKKMITIFYLVSKMPNMKLIIENLYYYFQSPHEQILMLRRHFRIPQNRFPFLLVNFQKIKLSPFLMWVLSNKSNKKRNIRQENDFQFFCTCFVLEVDVNNILSEQQKVVKTI